MAQKMPAWRRLVDEGFFPARDMAERFILAGAVFAGGQPVKTGGQLLDLGAPLSVKGLHRRFIAKGGEKLEGALDAFGLCVQGKPCIDAGASTGGFTDCLVKRGALPVYAVDVGYGQLAGSLRNHPSVVNLERTNISDASLLALCPTPVFATVDLSYISLRKAVPQFARILKSRGDMLCLVKPLFEIADAQARRSGVVADSDYAPLLFSLADYFASEGYAVRGITHSPVTGNNGTREFFLWLGMGDAGSLTATSRLPAIETAVKAALDLPLYHKT